MINANEIQIAKDCISFALENGADAVRVYLSKSGIDSCNILNGELDKVTHSADRSIYFYLYVDGKYGTYSTNRLVLEELKEFILNGIAMTRMLGEDPCRRLPEPCRTADDAKTGREMGLYDDCIGTCDSESRLEKALQMSIFGKEKTEGYVIISEECEYSESYDDSYTADSQGFEGRHSESTFSCFTEITVQAESGDKYSGFWWDSACRNNVLQLEECSRTALKKAVSQIGPKPRKSGTYKMVVDTSVAARLVSPILTALNASSIQQKMSFLDGTIDKKVFPEEMTMMDMPREYGKNGSRLYDSEGVATVNAPIIENGMVKQYFVNTYNSLKMDIPPTVEDASRPYLLPFIKGRTLTDTEKEVSLTDILQLCGNGILVTGFNGGNSNPATGDFSFGIEGFAFSRGKITHPVREMLITGNLMELWNGLIAAGSDMRPSVRWQIGSLAFEKVSFSA